MKEREIIRHCGDRISSFWPLIGLHERERDNKALSLLDK